MEHTAPRPSRRNPFKSGSPLARQFDGMLAAYASGHPNVIRNGRRCRGNSLSSAFWKGYDKLPAHLIQRDSFAWAAYRAGQAQRLVDDARGVFISPEGSSPNALANV